MDAKEVDLSHLDWLAVDHHVDGDTRDATVHLLLGTSTDADEPFLLVPWHEEGPSEEFNGVVESEHCVVIFDIVLGQQSVHFLGHDIVLEVNVVPSIAGGQCIWILLYIGKCFDLDGLIEVVIGQRQVFTKFWHWHLVPEPMWAEERYDIFESAGVVILVTLDESLSNDVDSLLESVLLQGEVKHLLLMVVEFQLAHLLVENDLQVTNLLLV